MADDYNKRKNEDIESNLQDAINAFDAEKSERGLSQVLGAKGESSRADLLHRIGNRALKDRKLDIKDSKLTSPMNGIGVKK